MLNLCLKSLLNRRFVAGLTVLSIALSVALILGVERLRTEARAGFANSASGVDLIVAARGNDVQILMATVFGVGSTGAGISWDSYEMVEDMPGVDWTVPVMMGDSHRGYPVMGTTKTYFERFRHSGGKPLTFAAGAAFDDPMGAVIGADVAQAYDYALGMEIVNAHGAGAVSFDVHDDDPFTIDGVLAPTGTAVDRMVFVSMEGFDTMHEDAIPQNADPFAKASSSADDIEHEPHDAHSSHDAHEGHSSHDGHEEHTDEGGHEEGGHDEDGHEEHHAEEEGHEEHGDHTEENSHEGHTSESHDDHGHDSHGHEPGTINAIFVGLKDKSAVLSVQRHLAEYRGDALTAVLPNVALLQLWSITGTAETALRLMAGAVALAGVIGMVVMLSAALDARRREFAILRSVGATPGNIFSLILFEAALVLLAGIFLGYLVLSAVTFVANPVLAANFGLRISLGLPTFREALLLAVIFCSGLIAGAVPALRVYRMTLADGLSMRL
ncbi:ABC transporter permease [Parasedimentitalea huanghaiensis]|uniref:FtsX-like permease family protein n=1 Tax=Parasedimentitalea huanghaiensis TaxID=2682100 RepID=A0A6L6WNJ6_9RHOB|nr:ABC transporter permease [Zongyanglinia huanghaiensis]MVO17597.1 FtsX-like permease family protein [Zongyanglinia huanghaiensis]